jgi:PAS domain S-box-containing protein
MGFFMSISELAIAPTGSSRPNPSLRQATMPVTSYPSGLRLYTNIVIALGLTLLVAFADEALGVDPTATAALALLAVVTSFFKLNLQLPGGGATMTLGHAVGFVGLLTLGPHATAMVVAVGIWTQCTYRPERRTPMDLRRRFFSVACGIVTVEAAGWVFNTIGGLPGEAATMTVPLAAAALVYFFANTVLVAGAIALSTETDLGEVWYRNFLWSGPGYFTAAAIAGLGTTVVDRYGSLVAVVLGLPLLLTFLAYRAYLGRIAQEQEHLRHTQDYTESVIHSMNEMLLVVDPRGSITTTNAATCELLGYREAELVGQSVRSVLVDDSVTSTGDAAFVPTHNVEVRLRTKHGEEVPVLFSSSPLAAGRHGTEGMVCVALDLRERKRAEAAARAGIERLQRQQATLADVARDKALHIGDLEPAARLLTAAAARVTDAAIVDLRLFVGPDSLLRVDAYHRATDRHTAGGVIDLATAPGLTPTLMKDRVITVTAATPHRAAWHLSPEVAGTPAWSVLHAPVRQASSTVGVVTLTRVGSNVPWSLEDQHFAASLADLASLAIEARDRRRSQEELERAKDAAEAANRAKSAFVANMSHELRTPLNAILGYCELIQEETLEGGGGVALPDLKRIEQAGKHLLSLVNDVLDFSKIEAGKVTLDLEDFEAAPLIRDAVLTARLAADRNGNKLSLDIDAGLGWLRGDARRLRQVVINVVGNACKFTRDGQVTVRANCRVDSAGEWVTLEVEDTGVGMSEPEMNRLFREFAQADDSTTRRFGGTGLGLAISQRLCRLMGGTIGVRSVKGEGSVFTVTLPINRPTTVGDKAVATSQPEPASV